MKFRTRVHIALLGLTLLPLIVLGILIRGEVERRLSSEAEARVTALVDVIRRDVADLGLDIASRLHALAQDVESDNLIRAILAGGTDGERSYLLDYGATAAALTGLDMLQIQTRDGRILSSGHFRNEFDRREAGLAGAIARAGGAALVQARTAAGPFLALASVDSAEIGGTTLHLVGGVTVDADFLDGLASDPSFALALSLPSSSGVAAREAGHAPADAPLGAVEDRGMLLAAEVEIPFADPAASPPIQRSTMEVHHTASVAAELRRSTDRWFAAAFGGAAILALVAASWLASLVTRPLEELASKTAQIDLERLDVRFATGRRDELGRLSRLLQRMTERIRSSARGLKEAERRATMGEVARQVNHDIKNGLAPIRNVLSHLTQVGADAPAELPRVLKERQGTLTSSVRYLEELAGNYARIGERSGAGRSDLNRILKEVGNAAAGDPRGDVTLRLASALPPVACDPIGLRRVIENLVSNALDAVEGGKGLVTIQSEDRTTGVGGAVRVTVEDNGPGMSDDEMTRAFEDFYTTKEEGSGLGLSVVRRIVMDAGGSVRSSTAPGKGTTFVVELPAAADGRRASDTGSQPT